MRGRETKKGTSGIAAQYITRTQAVRKLQVTLKDFRRLCIVKGIYPRDPKKKIRGNDKTYYHKKDINFLMHEPLLLKFREIKAFTKKLKRARGRKNWTHAKKLQLHKPSITLDHLVKERYPRFVDALRDLDDPLSMMSLFACLPGGLVKQHAMDYSLECQQLTREFHAFLVRDTALRKVFVSIKGIYYQAEIVGQEVTWLVPHQFTQHLPSTVDYRVMVSFLEFYMTLLSFVNHKLYHDRGWAYPPVVDTKSQAAGEALQALKVQPLQTYVEGKGRAAPEDEPLSGPQAVPMDVDGTQQKKLQRSVDSVVKRIAGVEGSDDDGASGSESDSGSDAGVSKAEDRMDVDGDDAVQLDDFTGLQDGDQLANAGLDRTREVLRSLFKGCKFLLCRETPQESLEFVILCGGGEVVRETPQMALARRRAEAEVKGTSSGPRDPIQRGRMRMSKLRAKGRAWEGQDAEIELSEVQQALEGITHQVVDRPKVQAVSLPGQSTERQFVQPQWIYDSFNARTLLPCEPYAAGVVPPPHLSPFVDDEKEGYIPKQRELLKQWGAQDPVSRSISVEQDQKQQEQDDSEEEDEIVFERQLAQERKGIRFSEAADEADDEDEDDDSDDQQATRAKTKAPGKGKGKGKGKQQADAEKEMAKTMMDKKAARLYSRIQTGKRRKQAANDLLRNKREMLSAGQTKVLPRAQFAVPVFSSSDEDSAQPQAAAAHTPAVGKRKRKKGSGKGSATPAVPATEPPRKRKAKRKRDQSPSQAKAQGQGQGQATKQGKRGAKTPGPRKKKKRT